MKKKFILLAMMLLTLIGGGKFNVLNAQETTVKIGGEPSSKIDNGLPIYSYYCHSMSQQIYLATEMIDDDGNRVDGNITSLSLYNVSGTQLNTRKIDVYMAHIAESSLTTTGVSMTSDNLVFSGEYTFDSSTELTTIEFDPPFEYNGQDNIILTIVDNTGTAQGSSSLSNAFYIYNSLVDNNKRTAYHRKDAVGYNITDLKHTDGSTFSLNLGQNSNLIQFTIEPAAPAVMPSSVPEITSIEATHNSVTLSWNAVENAKKYNVYTSTGDLVNTVSATSYTIEGLNELTEYCYQVSAVNGEFETEKSTASCATTLEAPKTQKIVFTLNDTYGDGWIANSSGTSYHTLTIKVNGEELKNLTINSGTAYTETLEINEGASVAVIFNDGGSWESECSYKIEYEDGEVITSESGLSDGYTYTFVVRTSAPKVTVAASAYDIYSDQTATLTATAANFDGDVTYSWSSNGEIVGTDATYTFDPSAAGIYTFTCTATDANNNEASASVTINVTERPALALNVTADKTEIYQGQNTMLYAEATGGFPDYSYNWFLNGEEHGTGWSFYFDQTEVDEYTVTCKVTDANGGTIEKSVTVNVLENKFYGKQFRIKALSYNTKDANGIYDGPNPFQNDMYLHITSHSSTDEALVWVLPYEETPNQKFSFELTNTDNVYYLRSADGYYLHCYSWNVGAYSTYQSTASPIGISYIDDTEFYLMNGSKYFKAEYGDGGNYKVYCDFDQQAMTATWVLEEVLPVIENLMASDTQLYPGETTTLTWDVFDGATSYNIYVNGELKYNTTEISYELLGLTYNVNGNTIEVIAVDENGTEISGKASVTVQVAGTFTLTVNVTDGTIPIEGATVNIDMAYACDEFKNQVSSVTVEPTDADGKTTIELPILCQETHFYNNNGTYVYTSYYTVEVSKSPYQDNKWNYINYYEDVTSGYTMDVVLTLPMVNYIQVQDEEGEDLYGDVMEGTNVVLSWEEVEGADAYKVYKLSADEVESSETVTETAYTIERILKGYQYAVSALFGELESEKSYASLQVKGNGYFKGYVTDGTNALEGIQVKVSSEYGNVSAVATTNEEGYFIGEIKEGENYKLTISHSDYEEYILEKNIDIIYNTPSDLGTIQLTAKPSASGITEVTATLNGENVDVNWTVDEAYTKYNVYRRLAGTQGKGDNIAQDVAVTSYTDDQWETLEPGTYQYGVAGFVTSEGFGIVVEEDFESYNVGDQLAGWIVPGPYSSVSSNYFNSGSKSFYTYYYNNGNYYFIMPYPINPEGANMSFYYKCYPYYGTVDKLKVCYSTTLSEDATWTNFDFVGASATWEQVNIDLSSITEETIYIAFLMESVYANGIFIDDIVITGMATTSVETQIVWSNDVVKQGPATFTGEDTENPTAWNVDANWSTGSVPADGAEVTINANAVITGAVNVSNVTINAGTSLTVANGGALTVTGTISQASNYLLVLEEGGQIFQNNANVTARFRMSIDKPSDWSDETKKDGWQFISMPLENVPHTDFTSYGEYDLYKYDGSQNLEWQNHKDGGFEEEAFKSGVGYLASLKDAEIATVYGTLNVANPFTYRQYAYSAEKPLVNFHLVGNPFSHDINWTDFTISGAYFDSESGSVLENIQYFVDGYAIVDKNGNYQYYTSADNEPIKVGQGFFIKTLKNKVNLGYTPKRSAKSASNNSLNITATGNAGEDNVIINLAGKSEGFDKLQNFNDAIATVYVAEDGKNYGIYNCDADVQEVELSFNANQMGNYTISIQPNGKFQTVTLVDRFTGIETNMLVEDYHFTAMSNVNNNRFIVKLAVSDQQSAVSDNFVYQSGEDLIIDAEGTVQIIDVMGRVLLSDEVESTNNRINVSGFRNGTYMVRVINGSEVKVEKVVIY